jgi:uncharacterized glyoxalase superfamily protein PhnB
MVRVLGLREVMNLGWTAPVNPNVSIEVDDVDSAYRAAVDAGLTIVHPLSDEDWGVRRFFFADPAGNVVNVLSHRR